MVGALSGAKELWEVKGRKGWEIKGRGDLEIKMRETSTTGRWLPDIHCAESVLVNGPGRAPRLSPFPGLPTHSDVLYLKLSSNGRSLPARHSFLP